MTFLENLTFVLPGNLPCNQSCHLCGPRQRKTSTVDSVDLPAYFIPPYLDAAL